MNILVVDDEQFIRSGIERTIKTRFPNYIVYQASNPEAAIAILKNHHIDLVLTDVLMPGMTGIKLMEQCKHQFQHIEWVFISAYSEFQYAKEALRLGAKDYLLKPIGKDVLTELVMSIAEQIQEKNKLSQDKYLLHNNVRLFREAVFTRWAMGLDLGNVDIHLLTKDYPQFYVLLVKLERKDALVIEHFIVENVLNECIHMYGDGFVASLDTLNIAGVISLENCDDIQLWISQLQEQYKKCLKVDFQLHCSPLLTDAKEVPLHLKKMRSTIASVPLDASHGTGQHAIEVAEQYIKSNYNTEITLEKVASIVYLNPIYFSQLFKQKTGIGFKEYVTKLRMERAIELLLESDMKIVDICYSVGYADVRHFSQIFRKKQGVTPSEFRLHTQVH